MRLKYQRTGRYTMDSKEWREFAEKANGLLTWHEQQQLLVDLEAAEARVEDWQQDNDKQRIHAEKAEAERDALLKAEKEMWDKDFRDIQKERDALKAELAALRRNTDAR
jgi:hypothetical protein